MNNPLKCWNPKIAISQHHTEKNRNFKKFAAKNPKIAQKNRKCELILTITKMQAFLSAD